MNVIFPDILLQKIWHTTSSFRYQKIMEYGSVLANPPIDDSERWGGNQGPDFYPYTRHLGGISLFDFSNFDQELYSAKYPLSNWQEFIPFRMTWGRSFWIEIDKNILTENFISPENLILKWKKEQAYRHKIMPLIEAAYIGNISKNSFKNVFICGSDTTNFVKLSKQSADARHKPRS